MAVSQSVCLFAGGGGGALVDGCSQCESRVSLAWPGVPCLVWKIQASWAVTKARRQMLKPMSLAETANEGALFKSSPCARWMNGPSLHCRCLRRQHSAQAPAAVARCVLVMLCSACVFTPYAVNSKDHGSTVLEIINKS